MEREASIPTRTASSSREEASLGLDASLAGVPGPEGPLPAPPPAIDMEDEETHVTICHHCLEETGEEVEVTLYPEDGVWKGVCECGDSYCFGEDELPDVDYPDEEEPEEESPEPIPEPPIQALPILDQKVQRMLHGERVVISDKECDEIAEMDADWVNLFGTLPNPQRVGVLDAWVGFIRPDAVRAQPIVNHLSDLIEAADARLDLSTTRAVVDAWEKAEEQFIVLPQCPDRLRMHFSNHQLDIVSACYNYDPRFQG